MHSEDLNSCIVIQSELFTPHCFHLTHGYNSQGKPCAHFLFNSKEHSSSPHHYHSHLQYPPPMTSNACEAMIHHLTWTQMVLLSHHLLMHVPFRPTWPMITAPFATNLKSWRPTLLLENGLIMLQKSIHAWVCAKYIQFHELCTGHGEALHYCSPKFKQGSY